MRAKHTALILTAGFLLLPTLTWSQGPGRPGNDGGRWQGNGGPGGGGFNPGQGMIIGTGQPGPGGGIQLQFTGGQPFPGGGGPGGGGPRQGRMSMDPDALFTQF